MPSIDLTKAQWVEVYYAMSAQVNAIKKGFYGPQDKRGADKHWIEDLKEIMEQIQGETDV